MKKIQISPSILSADFSQLGNEIKRLEEGGADMIHVDVMDGHFVPNLTIGPPVIKALRKQCSIKFDVHLMISPVHKYIEAYADAGADIIGVSSSIELVGSDIESEIVSRNRRFTAYQCDFRDRNSLYTFIETLQKKHAVIDILVNNAGVILRGAVEDYSDSMWEEVIEVNQNAQFILTREIGKSMLLRGSGKIVFIASLLSFQGGINVPAYTASKGAVAQLTKAFANQWASKGINVNAIAPGYIETDNTKPLIQDKKRSESILNRIPANRWGKAVDLAGPIVLLCSQASDYMHGSILVVDGGWLAR